MNRSEIIKQTKEIALEYDGNLTIRQAYYQLVARGFFVPDANDKGKLYAKLVATISKARLDGEFPFELLIDRTRTAHPSAQFDDETNVKDALDTAAQHVRNMPLYTIHRDRWFNQPKYVVVGVEKEALAGVFEGPCKELGVGLFVFRGYASISSLYQLTKHFEDAMDTVVEEAVVLYFGDHDPDGWEIPRAAERTVERIAEVEMLDIPPVRWDRKALLMPQIKKYNPPPFTAKDSSSRYDGYVREHGTTEAWELDALRPDVLQALIRSSVEAEFDEGIHQDNQKEVSSLREVLRGKMLEHEWLKRSLEGVKV